MTGAEINYQAQKFVDLEKRSRITFAKWIKSKDFAQNDIYLLGVAVKTKKVEILDY